MTWDLVDSMPRIETRTITRRKERLSQVKRRTLNQKNTIPEENEDARENENMENDETMAASAAKVQGKKIENKKSEESPMKTNKDLKAGKMKNTVCPHLKKERCHFGLTGRREHEGKAECPFNHPRTFFTVHKLTEEDLSIN